MIFVAQNQRYSLGCGQLIIGLAFVRDFQSNDPVSLISQALNRQFGAFHVAPRNPPILLASDLADSWMWWRGSYSAQHYLCCAQGISNSEN
jgi:hypothetical protein